MFQLRLPFVPVLDEPRLFFLSRTAIRSVIELPAVGMAGDQSQRLFTPPAHLKQRVFKTSDQGCNCAWIVDQPPIGGPFQAFRRLEISAEAMPHSLRQLGIGVQRGTSGALQAS